MKAEMRDKLAQSLLLYAVTDRHWLGDRTLYDVVRESLEGGVTFLQLREKDLQQRSQSLLWVRWGGPHPVS